MAEPIMIQPYVILTFYASLALSSLWLLVVLSAYVWGWVWAWVDDTSAPKYNAVVLWSMKLQGYELAKGSIWDYKKGPEGSDGERGFFYPLLALFFGPWVIAAAILFYPVALAIATAVALAHVARFARRHKKLFDKHIVDPNAHQKE